MVLLFIGPSGSGKDTQADLMVKGLGYMRVSSGALLRDISDGNYPVQVMLRDAMNEGFLPDNLVFGLLQVFFAKVKNPNLILSGVVRRTSQVELLDNALLNVNKKLSKVVYFDLNDEEAVRRMSGRIYCPNCSLNYHLEFNPPKRPSICDNCGHHLLQREDDNPDAIRKRLKAFHEDNADILNEYKKRGILVTVDASKTIDEIYQDLLQKLELKED